jgi:hypothetical protein
LTDRGEKGTLEVRAKTRNVSSKGYLMALRFVGIDPETGGDHCPAVFIDEETGDFLLQGWTVTDPDTLAAIAGHSPIADNESVVRLPARMRQIILEAASGHGTAVPRADRGDDDLGGAPGDAGRVHAV